MAYIYLTLYILAVIGLFTFALTLFIYSLFSLVAHFAGSPYVPTKQKEVEFILEKAKLKKGQNFIELGSGDGRVVRTAAKKYGVFAVGIEIHPLLVWYSQFLARLQNIRNITFRRQNFFKTDLTESDVVFLFLLPRTLTKLRPKFEKECRPKTLFISHGFKIEGWEPYLIEHIVHKPFPTYFYRLDRMS